jgi:5-methylcytosine-specific restriction protein A
MSWGVRRQSWPKLYASARWRKGRAKFLEENPLCAWRKVRNGCTGMATVVDHIKPHRGDRRLFYNRRNWQPMCWSCHSAKTAEELRGGIKGADENGMPLDPDHHWSQE